MDIVHITKIIPECERVSTIKFEWDAKISPGQFVMVWVPGSEEIPMSISFTDGEKGITVENRGSTTAKMHELAVNDKLGIRGPFGNGFEIAGDNILIIGGGTGSAPLAPLVEKLCGAGKKVTAAIGARSSCNLVFAQRFEGAGSIVHQATDDGTGGHQGFVTELAVNLLAEQKFYQIYACGPEQMMVEMVRLADTQNIPIQCSLERFMKCGIGICDSCSIDGLQVCKDGPVFDGQILLNCSDFGKVKRAKPGQKIPI